MVNVLNPLGFPNSPTGTTGLQKSFAVQIRKTFRDRLRLIFEQLQRTGPAIQEQLRLKSALDPKSISFIVSMLEGVRFDLSPIVQTYIGATWWKANKSIAGLTGLGEWVPFDRRIVKSVQDNAYNFLDKYVEGQQNNLKKILETGMSQGDSIATIGNEVKKTFKLTAWKSELIARSETIRTYGNSSRMAIEKGGVTKEYRWLTSLKENVCPVCRPLHGRIFNLKSRNSPMPVTDTHPQCNCGIVPHVRI